MRQQRPGRFGDSCSIYGTFVDVDKISALFRFLLSNQSSETILTFLDGICFLRFQVKAVVLDPDNEFNVDRTLTKDDVQKLIMVRTRWRKDKLTVFRVHVIVQLVVKIIDWGFCQ